MGFFVVVFLYFFAVIDFAAAEVRPLSQTETYGYLNNVSQERSEKFQEIFLSASPPKPQGPPLKDIIFNAQLSREFRTRYEEKFGRTEAEKVYSHPNPNTQMDAESGFVRNVKEDYQAQREFSEYMIKRLAEWHFDNYLKNEPSVKPVYDFKEKYSKLEVTVRKGYKVNAQYSLSGNYIDILISNPYDIDTKVVLEMDPRAIGPTRVEETKAYVGYQSTPKIYLESAWKTQDGVVSASAKKALHANMEGSLIVQTPVKAVGRSLRENKVFTAFRWTY
jgi:hypothetical protein